MIAAGVFDQMDIAASYPPNLVVHMPKDTYRQHKISQLMQVLRSKGIDATEVERTEFPLSPNIFADRFSDFDDSVSSKLFELFGKEGFFDEYGDMKTDGRRTCWREAVSKEKTMFLPKELFQHVQEELDLAFAYHEMTSLPSQEIFKWF